MAKKSKPPKPPKDSSKLWTVMSVVAGLVAAQVTKRVLNGGWKAATGKEPPANPADPDVAMREAVAWAAVSGTTIALARMIAGRRAASYYARSTGHLPPELQSDEVREARARAAERAQADFEASAQSAKASGGSGRKRRKG